MNFTFVKDKVKTSILFKSIETLNLKDSFELEIAKLMHSSFNHCYLKFKYASKQHDYKTRSITADNIYLEPAKTRNGLTSIFCFV